MAHRVSELFSLYKFPMGRVAFALGQVESRARDVGRLDVATLARESRDEVQGCMRLALRYEAGRDSIYPPEALELDAAEDRCIGGIEKYLEAQVRIYDTDPQGHAADAIRRALLPGGIAVITQASFAEQYAHIGTLLERARDTDLAPHLAVLAELPDMLDRLARLNEEFGACLAALDPAPTRADMNEARDRCQELVVGVFALIVGVYARDKDLTERDHLLEPILEQNVAIRAARRRRRAVADVDPQTGEELPSGSTDDEPADDQPTTTSADASS